MGGLLVDESDVFFYKVDTGYDDDKIGKTWLDRVIYVPWIRIVMRLTVWR